MVLPTKSPLGFAKFESTRLGQFEGSKPLALLTAGGGYPLLKGSKGLGLVMPKLNDQVSDEG